MIKWSRMLKNIQNLGELTKMMQDTNEFQKRIRGEEKHAAETGVLWKVKAAEVTSMRREYQN